MRYDNILYIAHEFKLNPLDVSKWSHRFVQAVVIWLNDQMNRPSRDNYYQMQIACEQRRMFSKNPASIKMDRFKLTFTRKNKESKAVTQEQRGELIKQKWIARMTAPITVVKDGVTQSEKLLPPKLRQKQELERQLAAQRRNADKRKKPTSTPLQEDTNGIGTGVRGIDGPNDGRRKQIRQNARRRKSEDGK